MLKIMGIYINIISLGCLILMVISVLIVVRDLISKNREEKILYMRSFKKGKGAVIYLFSIPLFWIGYIYTGQNIINSFFYAIRRSVELIVLRYDVSPIQSIIEDNILYRIAIYLCFSLVCLNAILFIISLANQHLWRFCKELKFKYSNKEKIILLGNNIHNHSIYLSDKNRKGIIIAKISNDDAQSLYIKDILYRNQEPSHQCVLDIINRSIKSKSGHIVIINTENDAKNIEISRSFINAISQLNDENRLNCFRKLRIFVFGDPKYETIYEDIEFNSCGCVSHINKYKKIAIDIVEKHPFSLYMNDHHVDYSTSLVKDDVEINALLVGFGKTNQQFFLTSVANNQFATQTESGIGLKSVNYHLFDQNAVAQNKKLNHSYNRYESEFANINIDDYLPLPEHPAKTYFHKLDINDNAFYKDIYSVVSNANDSVNFVVIAFGSDLENIDMAKKLSCKFREWRITNFNIFVKVRNHNNDVKFNKDEHCYIVANEDESVYNIERILSDNISNMAQLRDIAYEIEYEIVQNNTSSTQERITAIKERASRDWYLRKTQLDRESCVYCCLSLRSRLNLIGLDYCSLEDCRKAISEQEYLSIYALDDMPDFSYYNMNADGKRIIHYPLDYKASLRRNLAIQEHLRWNSFMISKGIVPATREQILSEITPSGKYTNGKNVSLRRHGCLTTFDGLLEYRKIIANRDLLPNETMQQAEVRKDVIKYDYQLMDDAYWLLTKSGYKIIRK